MKKIKFITRCEWCREEIKEPDKCIGSRPDTICFYCKEKLKLKRAPIHKLCDKCFLGGHKIIV